MRATDGGAVPATVSVRPALWRVGLKGAPPAEPAAAVPGEPGTFATSVWIMRSGSYAFHVAAAGAAGSGTLVVPVVSVATTASAVPVWLGWVLAAAGTFLVLGLISIVGAASREGSVPAGAVPASTDRRRAKRAMAVAGCIVAAMLFGGWKWWDAVDRDYRASLDKPVQVESAVTAGDARALTLRITDQSVTTEDENAPGVRRIRGTPLMPDHGKIMHLFLVAAGAQGGRRTPAPGAAVATELRHARAWPASGSLLAVRRGGAGERQHADAGRYGGCACGFVAAKPRW